jgi:hypothetical protein
VNINKSLKFAKTGYCVMINDLEQEKQLKSTAEEISKIISDNTRVGYVIEDVSQKGKASNLRRYYHF